ncbi:MAG: 4Fe-4S binding protein [Bacteroidales bacterium]|nr:4Fe-4S binding protein [Bacteroidales bacterium]
MNTQQENFHHALKFQYDLCIGCAHCTEICPTAAIHIEGGLPVLNPNRCIDCGRCYSACPVSAIYVEQDDFQTIYDYKTPVALVPSIFFAQFPEKIDHDSILAALHYLGFKFIYEVEESVEVLKHIMNEKLTNEDCDKPMISSFCPAIVRLIQVKFPSLVNNIMLVKPPLDLTSLHIKKNLVEKRGIPDDEIGIFYVAPCPAKIAAIKSPVGEDKSSVTGVINMNYLYNKVLRTIKQGTELHASQNEHRNVMTRKNLMWSLSGGEIALLKEGRNLAIDEVHNVSAFLEKIENEDIDNIDFLEVRACDQSCAGGILCANNRFLTVERQKQRAAHSPVRVSKKFNELIDDADYLKDNSKVGKVQPRSMDKLDNDRAVAMQKMEKAFKINKFLPQVDCRICGYQTCKEFAFAVTNEVIGLKSCIFVQRLLNENNKITPAERAELAKKTWGEQKLDIDNIPDNLL